MYNETKPLVTVQLMVCEGDYALAARAIRSVGKQTLDADLFDLQVVFDGTPSAEAEESLSQALDRGAPKVRAELLHHGEATGYYTVPRNRTFPFIRGIYVAFMDADNEMAPGHLEGLLEAIRVPHEEDGWPHFVYSRRLYVIDGSPADFTHTVPVGPSPLAPWSQEAAARLMQGPKANFVDTGDIMVSTAVLYELAERSGFVWNSECRRFGDWDLVMRLAGAGFRGRSVDQVTNVYHWHGANLQLTRSLSEITVLPQGIYDKMKRQGLVKEGA